MGWRIVKQPNGMLARFSEVVDNFTHCNMTEEKALEVCKDCGCSQHEAMIKVDSGIRDLKPYTSTSGNGLERWEHCLGIIERVHGISERQRAGAIDQMVHPC